MQDQLRETCRSLLAEGRVQVVIGYGQSRRGGQVHPVFITRPEEAASLVWNRDCHANLVTYLAKPEVRELGRAAIVLKGCDERALVILQNESQIDREQVTVIGMACQGEANGRPKCQTCDVRQPRTADITLGEADSAPAPGEDRYASLARLDAMTAEERMAYWQDEFARCVKCYACRQACPMCYCPQCLADKNRPQALPTSASLRGNFAWQITRAFHLAGRCVGCGECTRVCPAGIDLELLNLSTARAAERAFGYRAGMEVGAAPLIGSHATSDSEGFIR